MNKKIVTAVVAIMVLMGTVPAQEADRPENVKPAMSGNDIVFRLNGEDYVYRMISVEGGTFLMGCSSAQESDCDSDELPAHSVTLDSYYIGETEVTQALWKAVMNSNPSNSRGDNFPVEKVSYNEVKRFVGLLNELTGRTFRLPTEAQWEFAARGGDKSMGYRYSGSDNLDEVAWYSDNAGGRTHPVGSLQANELGLYDMSGNVNEWCADWYGTYDSVPQSNPDGASSGTCHVNRGGSRSYSAKNCRVSNRSYNSPTTRFPDLGFRLVLAP